MRAKAGYELLELIARFLAHVIIITRDLKRKQSKMSRRFLPWVNKMTDAQTKQQIKLEEPVKEAVIKVVKIEYKLMDRMEKTIECKVIQNTYPVTKGYAERRKKAFDTEAFGVEKTADEIRNNIGLTIV